MFGGPRGYELPHQCETAEIAGLLAALSPRQRRVLRAYVWQVELGEQSVTEWLRREGCPICERAWYRTGERAQYLHSERFQAALAAYKQAGGQWQLAEEARAIAKARSTLVRAAPKAAARIVEHAEADPSAFYRTAERWTEDPPATAEVLDERKVKDELGCPHTLYLVRQVCIDLGRLLDPRYARLVRKVVDSPKNGFTIEFVDAQKAAESVLDRADVDTASKGQPAGGGVVVILPDNGRDAHSAPAGAADGLPAEPG